MTVARNRAIDVLRRATVERRKLRDLAVLALTAATGNRSRRRIVDDRLRLIFTCCHPALPLEARVALTLRTICRRADRRHRARVPGHRVGHDPAADQGQDEDRGRRHPVPGAERPGAHRAPARRPGRAVPAVHPGLQRRRRARVRRRGDPAGPAARAAHAGPAGGRRRCWRCSCSSTPGATPAATPPATCSPSTGRTGPAGTTPRSPRASRSWTEVAGGRPVRAAGPDRRLPRHRRLARTPTGRRIAGLLRPARRGCSPSR